MSEQARRETVTLSVGEPGSAEWRQYELPIREEQGHDFGAVLLAYKEACLKANAARAAFRSNAGDLKLLQEHEEADEVKFRGRLAIDAWGEGIKAYIGILKA